MLKNLLSFVFILILQASIFGQSYHFVNYSVEEGLPQSQIYSIYQDEHGYVWLGTFGGGLSRYDGIDFVNYHEEQGLSCSFVRAIVQVEGGNFLVGTDEGLYIMIKGRFMRYDFIGVNGNVAVRTIIIDQQKNIWVGTIGDGLFRYKDGNIEFYTVDQGLLSNNINCLYNDINGNIWVGHDNGFSIIKDGKIKSYNKAGEKPFTSLRAITGDKHGQVWLASYIYGVVTYDGKSFTKLNGLASNTIYSAYCDAKGNLWFGTAKGLNKLQGDSVKTITVEEGLCSNTIVSILEDTHHSLWFGSSGGGISRFDDERFIHFPKNEKMGKLVYDIQQDKEGHMWLAASNGGVTKFDGKEFRNFNEKDGFTSVMIKSILCKEDSSCWFGSNGAGAFLYDGETFEHYTYKDGLCGSFISGIDSDIYGNIWFSSLDKGVGFYKERNKTFYRYTKADGLASDRVNALCCAENGDIWVGTSNGVNRIRFSEEDSTSITISTINQSNGLTGNNINSLVCRNNLVYIGTSGGGINILDQNNRVISWKKKQGLGSNIIYSLVFDENGNLWSGSEKGIDKIVIKNERIESVVHFGKADGFVGVENTMNSSCMDSAGNLWFGTINGANMYNPDFDQSDTSTSKIQLTSVHLLFDRIEDTEYGENISSFEELSGNLILPYYKNHLSFNFIAINFKNPDAMKYKWKLEGEDNDWSPELSRREVTYSSLPPGKYTFFVKACNENGIWTSQPASFSFTITPPYWTSTWFIVLMGTLIVSALFIIVYTTITRVKTKNKTTRERLEMSKSILELQQATSRLQMNPHFIFNSLNSIQGYIATNNTTDAKWYLSKFAKLMRLILDNAREEFIPLRDEIYILENYLILERMRVNEKFDFTLDIDESIDTEAVEIPPMILQPFVENAVLHGFRHKEGKGLLAIVFTLKDDILTCEITDNGIGRQAASERKNKSAAGHKSSAITITEERLKKLSKESQKESGIRIIDLKDAEGNGSGTKVIIQIPI